MKLTMIGYWASPRDDRYPHPRDFVGDMPDDDRDTLVQFLRNGLVARTMMGYSPCRMCGVDNGSSELTDGTFIWPEGLAHYVEVHSVELPQVFIDYALDRIEEFFTSDVDLEWWPRVAKPHSDALTPSETVELPGAERD